jgi:hypothetical protein
MIELRPAMEHSSRRVLVWRRLRTCASKVTTSWLASRRPTRWGPPQNTRDVLQHNRPISVHRFPRRALTLCPQLCMSIQLGAHFPARSADALLATLYGHFNQAIYRNRPIAYPRFLNDMPPISPRDIYEPTFCGSPPGGPPATPPAARAPGRRVIDNQRPYRDRTCWLELLTSDARRSGGGG